MPRLKEVVHIDTMPQNLVPILVGDIGGTNSNFGIFQKSEDTLKFLLSIHAKSKEVDNFTDLVQEVLNYVRHKYGFEIKQAIFAAAGVPSEDRMYCKPTNTTFAIDINDIINKTGLACSYLVNDFEIIGYGLPLIKSEDIVVIHKGKPRKYANKAILGAGTGLGKSILAWNNEANNFMALKSEGGHSDFAFYNDLEFELVDFIKKIKQDLCPVSWEDVLSGYGIQRMHQFFHVKDGACQICLKAHEHKLNPDEIFRMCHSNKECQKTYELYTKFYARCAKNFALESLALGGIYITGGIAAKNLALFKQKSFMHEFIGCGKQRMLLQDIPIYVITDYNISLYGAAAFMLLDKACL